MDEDYVTVTLVRKNPTEVWPTQNENIQKGETQVQCLKINKN